MRRAAERCNGGGQRGSGPRPGAEPDDAGGRGKKMNTAIYTGRREVESTATRVIDFLEGGGDIQDEHDRPIEIAVDGAYSMLDDDAKLELFRKALGKSRCRLAFLDARSFPRDDRFAPQL